MQHATPSRLLGATIALLAFGLAASASAAIVPLGAASGGEDITFGWSARRTTWGTARA